MSTYICIDLKTFFASVECVERGLDPFKTDLIVADIARSKGAICLAISPKMKERGIKNRCRVYEIPRDVKPIVAKPRMKKYIEYAAKIYGIYLDYFSKEDIFVYSIDEVFIDATTYLKAYKKNEVCLAKDIIEEIYRRTGICATAGIGTNMYLAKIALDIISKHNKSHIGYLNEKLYKEKLWEYKPISDFWQVGKGIESRLYKHHLKTMKDVANCNPNILYKEFGINAEILIDHSLGKESCTLKEIKEYKPKSSSISHSQILFRNYNYKEARVVLIEMVDALVLELVSKDLYTSNISVFIGFSREESGGIKFSFNCDQTNSYKKILKYILDEYDYRILEDCKIRRIGISFNSLDNKKFEQLNLFEKMDSNEETILEKTINNIKNKFGKNSILRCISLDSNGTMRQRNKYIGGHNAE
ncbi:MAG: DNA repair protein [Bacilli bacterium]|nr:DNA repair protein [Bacilli bacterium]